MVIGGGDEEVIHVDDEPSLNDHILEWVVHEPLEGSGGVTEAEEHDCWFKQFFVGDEDRFPLVSILNMNVVVPPSDVKFGKDLGIFNLVDEVLDEGERICVLDGMTVYILVVLARLEGIRGIFLSMKKKDAAFLSGIQRTDSS